MNIGEAAKVSGVSAKMIHYYEQIGLIPGAARKQSGYRASLEHYVRTLRFVRRARDFGFSIEQIADLLALLRARSSASADDKRMANAHTFALERKIQASEALVQALRHLVDNCQTADRANFPILEDF